MTARTASSLVRAVSSPQDRERFLDVPRQVYAADPNWVAPLRSLTAQNFAPSNPFFEYGQLQQFIALDPGTSSPETPRAVGRIVAAINRRLIEREGKNVGIVGYFECVDDFPVAQALLESACLWLRERGMTLVRGPIDLSTHNNCLFLIDGFDGPPYFMMPYNPPYYPRFWERAGWQPAKDAVAYEFPLDRDLPAQFERAYRLARQSGIRFRPVRTRGAGFRQDLHSFHRLFTEAFSANWSSSARSEAEFVAEAESLRFLIDRAIFPVAEHEGEMVGFLMALPDYNQVLKHLSGALDWRGVVKFLWYRRNIDRFRVLAMASLPKYRGRLVAPALIHLCMLGVKGGRRRYRMAELSWVYADNKPSRNLAEVTQAKAYKRFRIYERALT